MTDLRPLLEASWSLARSLAAEARTYQSRHRARTRRSLLLAVAAALAGAGATALGSDGGVITQLSTGSIMALTAGVAATVSTIWGRQASDEGAQQKWSAARAAAELLQSECYRFALRVGPYADATEEAARAFDSETARIARIAGIKGIVPTQPGSANPTRPAPSCEASVEWYITNRIEQQLNWYREKTLHHTGSARRLRALGFAFGSSAAVFSFLASTISGWGMLTPFVGALTTISASITAFAAVDRHVFLSGSYAGYARAIESLLVRHRSGLLSAGNLVLDCEALLCSEFRAWSAGT